MITTSTPRLYVAPDGADVPSIWRERPGHALGDEQVLCRTGANAIAFDALVDLLGQREELQRIADDLCEYNGGHGDYLSAGKRIRSVLDGGAQ